LDGNTSFPNYLYGILLNQSLGSHYNMSHIYNTVWKESKKGESILDVEKVTAILEGISIGLSRIIVIIAPILAAIIIGAVTAGASALSNTSAVKKKVDDLKQLTNQDKI